MRKDRRHSKMPFAYYSIGWRQNMLQDMITDNSYPIVFIGSGISKRYLNGFPTWEELLKWDCCQIGGTEKFYSHLRNIKSNMDPSLTEEEKYFNANT